jgi:hypothetical protein
MLPYNASQLKAETKYSISCGMQTAILSQNLKIQITYEGTQNYIRNVLNNKLTPCSRVLPEKLTVPQLVKKPLVFD